MLKAAKRVLFSSVCLTACFFPAAALADPVSIGSTIGLYLFTAGVTVTGFTATTAAIIGNIILTAATVGAQLLLAGGSGGTTNPAEFKQNYDNPEGPEIRAVGRVKIGGLFNFRNTTGLDTYRSVLQCKGRIDAIENYFIGGREVVVNSSTGAVESPPWANSTATYCYIQNKVGDGSETAWPDLISAFPDLWTSDHKARGIAQLLVKFISPGNTNSLFIKLYGSAGVRDDIKTVIRAECVYDPREVSHDIDDASTWEWTQNGILNAAHLLRSFPSLSDSDFDWDDIALEADKADVLVATKTGTEPRARAWGVWGADGKSRDDIAKDMLRSIGAEISESDAGLIRIRLVDDNRTSELAYTTKQVVAQSTKYGAESAERVNVCRLRYYASTRDYELAELPLLKDDGITPLEWSRYEDEIDAVGEQPFDVDLPFCPSPSQAQRLARREFMLARAQTGTVVTNMSGVAAWGKRVVTFPFPDLDVDGDLNMDCQIGTPAVDDDSGTVEIPYVVLPTIPAWAPATDEAAPLPDIPEIQFESELDKPDAPIQAIYVQYPDLSYETRVKFAGVTDATASEANYRTYTGGLPDAWASMTEIGVTSAWLAGDLSGEKLDFRVRMINVDGDVSYFSDTLEINALATDNNTPTAPGVVGGATDVSSDVELDIDITIPDELRAVSCIVTRQIGADPQTTLDQRDVRQGDTFTVTDSVFAGTSTTVTYEIYTITTDGTESAHVVKSATTSA